jgi:putative peptide zinc metalloprotease protein
MDKLRSDLKIIREAQSGEVAYLVKDPVAQKYYRFGAVEYAVLKHLDGAHGHDEIAQLVKAEAGIKLSEATVGGFVASLKQLNLIERSAQEKSLLLLEHLRQERKCAAAAGANGRDVLYLRFPACDPDRAYDRLIKYIGFCWTRPFVIGCLVLFSLAATIITSHWETVSTGLARIYTFEGKGLDDILMFICVLAVVVFFHENGHGLTCKYYGGEVHELGFMLIYFFPACYANVTNAWSFASKAAKLWVTFAGIWVELIICSLASFVWYFSTPGYFTHELAFAFMLAAGLSSALLNLNPLIKLDGYFALVDYLEVPNLSDEAAKYVSALARKYIFRVPVQLPAHKPRLKRILFIYGTLAFCYRMLLLSSALFFIYQQIERLLPSLSLLLFPLLAYRLLKQRLKALWQSIHHLWLDKKEVLMKPKSLALASVASVVTLGLFIFVPLPYWHRTTFVIEPAARVPVRAATEGFIGKVLVREGEVVRRGAKLAVMRDPDLEQQCDSLRSEIALLDCRILLNRAQGATAESLAEERRRAQLSDELAETEARLRRLTITAPADGVVVTPKVEDRVGVLLKAGAEFCELAKAGAVRARVTVDDWYLKDVEVGATASLLFAAMPGCELKGRVTELAPFAASLMRFDAQIEIEAEAMEFKPGMSGEVKIYGRQRPLAVAVWHCVRDWFRSQVWW